MSVIAAADPLFAAQAIPEVVREELSRFRDLCRARRSGEIDEDRFRPLRVIMGVYGQRQSGVQMIRTKIPHGRLTANQLRCLADGADKFAPYRKGHLTTRQDIQFHFVPLDRVPDFLTWLAGGGLTTREAGGNGVRNVTGDPLAGVAPDEVFDITPYAEAVTRHFLRNPICQNMPRKFKIAFSGSNADRAQATINDVGCIATVRHGPDGPEKGFRVYIGGGLGSLPRMAQLIHDFLPVTQIIPFCEAAITVFQEHGNRENKQRARLKFVVEKLGFETFKSLVDAEFNRWLAATETLSDAGEGYVETVPDNVAPAAEAPAPDSSGYADWRRYNVYRQRQDGFFAVGIPLPLGDITSAQMRAVADITERYTAGTVRATNQQNLLLRWVPGDRLPDVYAGLDAVGLAAPGADKYVQIMSCPGAEICNLGITAARGLAAELAAMIGSGDFADVAGSDIKISGCPNSCGQHHVAALGFHGRASHIQGKPAPFYSVLIGGGCDGGDPQVARFVGKVPARRVTTVVEGFVHDFRATHRNGETFRDYLRALPDARAREIVKVASVIDGAAAELLCDVGQSEPFVLNAGKSDCAA